MSGISQWFSASLSESLPSRRWARAPVCRVSDVIRPYMEALSALTMPTVEMEKMAMVRKSFLGIAGGTNSADPVGRIDKSPLRRLRTLVAKRQVRAL